MSRLIRFFILFSIGLLISYLPIHQPTINAQQSAIEDSVKALINKSIAAAKKVNADLMISYYSDKYDMGFPGNGEYSPSLDSVAKVMKIGFNNLRSQKVDVREIKVAVLAPTVAIATMHGDATATTKLNRTFRSPFVLTSVLAKVKDHWKIIHEHQSFPHHYSLEEASVIG
ncbi:MAG: nuclear transport factor 2 family protein [candidate division KSB1 bacterium]|nr:nuclear transport factor 2 family protein [candidate division KSB1 bacterium]